MAVFHTLRECESTDQVQSPLKTNRKRKPIKSKTDESVRAGTWSNNIHVSVCLWFCFLSLTFTEKMSFRQKYHSSQELAQCVHKGTILHWIWRESRCMYIRNRRHIVMCAFKQARFLVFICTHPEPLHLGRKPCSSVCVAFIMFFLCFISISSCSVPQFHSKFIHTFQNTSSYFTDDCLWPFSCPSSELTVTRLVAACTGLSGIRTGDGTAQAKTVRVRCGRPWLCCTGRNSIHKVTQSGADWQHSHITPYLT
jgi:hypothetical protein